MKIDGIGRFNIHDKSIILFSFAESGYVGYKLSANGIPYVFQYMVKLDWTRSPFIPAKLIIPLSWSAYNIYDYCLPAYIDRAWEWIGGKAVERDREWRPGEEYVKEKYSALSASLFCSNGSGDRIVYDLAFDDWTRAFFSLPSPI